MAHQLIVMGVSGCGKSTVGEALAEKLNYPYHDGDSYHPQENIDKMARGEPLDDTDRYGWLTILNGILREEVSGTVLACSALKPHYREILVESVDNPIFVYLKGDFDTIWARHQQREGHYFQGKEMLESQFAILSEPKGENVITLDVSMSVESITQSTLDALAVK